MLGRWNEQASDVLKPSSWDSMEHCYYPETMPVLDTIIEIAVAKTTCL